MDGRDETSGAGEPLEPGASEPGAPAPEPEAPAPEDRPLVDWSAAVPGSVAASDAPVGAVARLVAYLVDALIVGVLPMLPVFFGMWQATGGVPPTLDPTDPAAIQAWGDSFASAVQPYVVGSTVGSVALSFVYFVGLWTSGGRATLGMRVVRFRIADAASGGPLGLGQGIRRWVAMGVPFTLLGVLPLAGLGEVGAAVPFWELFLLISIAADPLKLGLHDKFAATRMERLEGGRLRIGLGCASLIAIYVALVIVLSVLAGALFARIAG